MQTIRTEYCKTCRKNRTFYTDADKAYKCFVCGTGSTETEADTPLIIWDNSHANKIEVPAGVEDTPADTPIIKQEPI